MNQTPLRKIHLAENIKRDLAWQFMLYGKITLHLAPNRKTMLVRVKTALDPNFHAPELLAQHLHAKRQSKSTYEMRGEHAVVFLKLIKPHLYTDLPHYNYVTRALKILSLPKGRERKRLHVIHTVWNTHHPLSSARRNWMKVVMQKSHLAQLYRDKLQHNAPGFDAEMRFEGKAKYVPYDLHATLPKRTHEKRKAKPLSAKPEKAPGFVLLAKENEKRRE